MKLGVIDIGTNSCHLVVASISKHGDISVLDTDKISLQLGKHIDPQGCLTKKAINNTITAVSRMKEICKGYRADIKAVATHAVRSAKNQHELIRQVKSNCGVLIEPIDGVEEARLIFLGMKFGLSLDERQYLGVDIGGGSTEIISGTPENITYATSVKLGAVTMSVRFFPEVPTEKKIEELKEFITTELESHISRSSTIPFSTAIVSSGTGKAIASIDYFLRTGKALRDANGYTLSHNSLLNIVSKMEELRLPEKIEKEFSLDKSRAEIILAGSLILKKISALYKVRQWKVSTCCLREGIVIDTYEQCSNHDNVRWQSVISLGDKFKVDQRHAKKVLNFALNVLQEFPQKLLPPVEYIKLKEFLSSAAYLHEVGKIISSDKYHKHSYYIIMNSSLMGFNRHEKEIIARITRYHRKKNPDSPDYLYPDDNIVVRILSAVLRISVAGFRLRQNRILGVKIYSTKVLTFIFYYNEKNFPAIEMYNLNKEKDLIEEALGIKISFTTQRRELN